MSRNSSSARRRSAQKRKNRKKTTAPKLCTEPLESRILLTVQPILSDFVLFGEQKVDLGSGTQVLNGFIGSNNDVIARNETSVQSIFADDEVRLHDDSILNGNIRSNRLVEIEPDSQVIGNIDAENVVQLRARAEVTGNVVSGGNVVQGNDIIVGGAIVENGAPESFGTLGLPLTSSYLTDTSADVTSSADEVLPLAPGSYGNLRLLPRSTLQLSSGVYFFDEIHADQELKLELNLQDGPIELFSEGRVLFENGLDVDLIGGDASQVYFESGSNFFVRHTSELFGTIVAADGRVEIDRDSSFVGSVYADQITIGSDVTVDHAVVDSIIPDVTIAESDGGTVVAQNASDDSILVSLESRPRGDVLVSLAHPSSLSLSDATLTFTPSNWNVPQSVVVSVSSGAVLWGNHVRQITATATAAHIIPATANETVGVHVLDKDDIGEGDFNGDGVQDLFRHGGDSISVGINQGDELDFESWSVRDFVTQDELPAIQTVWAVAYDVVVGDFNGDNHDDLLSIESNSAAWSIARSTGDQFDRTEMAVSGWSSFAFHPDYESIVADFNGDGRDDIAQYNPNTDSWGVAESHGTSFSMSEWTAGDGALGAGIDYAVAADINGDLRNDLVVLGIDGGVSVLISSGSHFDHELWATIPASWSPVATPLQVADVNADGKSDIVVERSNGRYRVGLSQDHSFDYAAWANLDSFVGGAQAVDVNNDGKADLVGRNGGTWQVGLASGSEFVQQSWAMSDGTSWFAALGFADSSVAEVVDHTYRHRAVLKEFRDIQSSIDFLPSFGSLRGPSVTSESGEGNAFDHASLFASRLETVADTQYVVGRLRVNVSDFEQLANWLGVTEAAEAVHALDAAGLNPYVSNNGAINFDHAWTQARIPTSSGLAWVDFDASWKQYVRPELPQLTSGIPFWQPSIDVFESSSVSYSEDFNGISDYGELPSSLAVIDGAARPYSDQLLLQDDAAVIYGLNKAANGSIGTSVEISSGSNIRLFGRATEHAEYGLNISTNYFNQTIAQIYKREGDSPVDVLEYEYFTEQFGTYVAGLEITDDSITATLGSLTLTATDTAISNAGAFGFAGLDGDYFDDVSVSLQSPNDDSPKLPLLERYYASPNVASLMSHEVEQRDIGVTTPFGKHSTSVVGTQWTNEHQHRVRITVNSDGMPLIQRDVDSADLLTEAVSVLADTDANEVSLESNLFDVQQVAVSSTEGLTLYVQHFGPGENSPGRIDSYDIPSDGFGLLSGHAGHLGFDDVHQMRSEANDELLLLSSESPRSEKNAGIISALELLNADFIAHSTHDTRLINEATSALTVIPYMTTGFAAASRQLMFDESTSFYATPDDIYLDQPTPALVSIPLADGAAVDVTTYRNFITAAANSYLENTVITRITGSETASAANALRYAQASGQAVYRLRKLTSNSYEDTFTGSTYSYSSLMAMLSHPSFVKTRINEHLDLNQYITISAKKVRLGGWHGSPYLVEDPSGAIPAYSSFLVGIDGIVRHGASSDEPDSDLGSETPNSQSIDSYSGRLTWNDVDVTLPASVGEISVTRTWRSDSDTNLGFGPGWTFLFGELITYNDYQLTLLDGAGQEHVFSRKPGTNTYVGSAPTLPGSSMFFDASSQTFTLTLKDGTLRRYAKDPSKQVAYFSEFKDLNGNRLLVDRDSSDVSKIVAIQDKPNALPTRTLLNFTYQGNFISNVTDGIRTWDYSYRTFGERRYLTSIDGPESLASEIATELDLEEQYYLRNGNSVAQGPALRLSSSQATAGKDRIGYLKFDTSTLDQQQHQVALRFKTTEGDGAATVKVWLGDHSDWLPSNVDDVTPQSVGLLGTLRADWREDRWYEIELSAEQFESLDAATLILTISSDSHQGIRIDPDTISLFSDPDVPRANRYEYDQRPGLEELIRYTTNPTFGGTEFSYFANRRALGYESSRLGVQGFTYNTLSRESKSFSTAKGLATQRFSLGGLLEHEESFDGSRTTYEWDEELRLVTRMVEPGWRVTEFSYGADGLNNLVSHVDPSGLTTLYEYESDSQQVSKVTQDPDVLITGDERVVLDTVYDSDGNPVTVTDAAGNVQTFEYTPQGYIDSATSAKGNVAGNDSALFTTRYTYNAAGQTTQIRYGNDSIKSYSYDTLGRMISETDETGITVTFGYDALDRIVTETTPDPYAGTSRALGVLVTSHWFGDNRLVSRTSQADGTILRYAYDESSRKSREIYEDGTSRSYAYNERNLLHSTQDRNGTSTNYLYDAQGRLTQTMFANGATEVSVFNAAGSVVLARDERGFDSTYKYDVAGRLWQETNALGDSAATAYDEFGNVILETSFRGIITTHTYDALNRIVESRFSDLLVQQTEYDENGNVSGRSSFDISGLAPSQIPANLNNLAIHRKRVESIDYDERDRPFRWTDPIGRSKVEVLDDAGRVLSQTNERLATTDFEYDLLGRLHRQIDPAPIDGSARPVTLFEYDELDRMTSETDALGRVTQFRYDIFGEQTVQIDPIGNESRTIYDVDGNVAVVRDALNRVSVSSYDPLNRKVLEAGPLVDALEGAEIPISRFTLDAAGNVVESRDALGRVSTFKFDSLNRRILSTLPDPDGLGPLTPGSVLTTYDADGNVASMTDQLGRMTTYQYDDLGRQALQTISDPQNSATVTEQYEYNAWGDQTLFVDALGRTTTYVYNRLSQQVQVRYPQVTGDGLPAPVTYASYDPVGNLRFFTDELGRLTEYRYDRLNRLITEFQPDPDGAGPLPAPLKRFTYDLVGNLTNETDQLWRGSVFTYNDLDQRISHTFPDPDGNGPLSRPVNFTTYDSLGNVLTETDPLGRTTSYEYDALNRQTVVRSPQVVGDGFPAPTQRFEFDLAGNLVKSTDEMGQITRFEYDGQDRHIATYLPQVVGDGLPAPSEFMSYDRVGNLIQTTDVLGAVTNYEFDYLDRVTRTSYSSPDVSGANPFELFEYDAVGNVVSVTDFLGRKSQFSYDELDRLTQSYLPDPTSFRSLYSNGEAVTWGGGDVTLNETITYDLAGNILSNTDAFGRKTESTYDGLDRVVSVSYTHPAHGNSSRPTEYTRYDAAGNVVEVEDLLGRVTEYQYDNLDRQTLVTLPDPDGNGILHSPTLASSYDAADNLIATVDNVGRVTTYSYDELNRLTATVYPDPDLTDGIAAPSTHSTYDLVDNVISSVNELGQKTTYEYDELHRLVAVVLPDPAVYNGNNGPRTEYSYDLAGNVTSERDALGRITSREYDLWSRMTLESNPDPDGSGPLPPQTLEYVYDLAGNVVATFDHVGRITTSKFDGLDREVEVTSFDPDGSGAALSPVVVYSYDFLGNLIGMTDELGRRTEWAYDRWDRQVRETLPGVVGNIADGPITRWSLDLVGNTVLTTDQLGKLVEYEYDALDREVSMKLLPEPGSSGPQLLDETTYKYDDSGYLIETRELVNVSEYLETRYEYDRLGRQLREIDANGDVTSYEYDKAGNLTSITDATNNTTAFVFDALDRMVTSTNELGNSRSYKYDAVGNMTEVVDRNGRKTTYHYDAIDRLVFEKWWSGTTTINTIAHTYDERGNLSGSTDQDHNYIYWHDDLNRVKGFAHANASNAAISYLTYTYDAANNLTRRGQWAGGVQVLTDYLYSSRDEVNRIEQHGGGTLDKIAIFEYDDGGRLERITRKEGPGNGVHVARTDYTYDYNDHLIGLEHYNGGVTFANYAFEYDLASRMTKLNSSVDGLSTYELDSTGQLLSANHSAQTDESYTYDASGNRIQGGYAVGPNNQMLSDGIFTYQYDAEGNRTRRTKIADGTYTDYVWDHRNRLSSVADYTAAGTLSSETTYGYDANDQRIVRQVDLDGDGVAEDDERYIVDGDTLVTVMDQTGVINRYMHGPEIDQVLAEENSSGDVYWLLSDHQGTVRDIAERSGGVTQVANHRVFDSFGNLKNETNAAVDHLFGFTGREFDDSTGLYNYRSRWFDPASGEFLSEDPAGFAAGDANLTRYVGNGPVDHVDPTGMFSSGFASIAASTYASYSYYSSSTYSGYSSFSSPSYYSSYSSYSSPSYYSSYGSYSSPSYYSSYSYDSSYSLTPSYYSDSTYDYYSYNSYSYDYSYGSSLYDYTSSYFGSSFDNSYSSYSGGYYDYSSSYDYGSYYDYSLSSFDFASTYVYNAALNSFGDSTYGYGSSFDLSGSTYDYDIGLSLQNGIFASGGFASSQFDSGPSGSFYDSGFGLSSHPGSFSQSFAPPVADDYFDQFSAADLSVAPLNPDSDRSATSVLTGVLANSYEFLSGVFTDQYVPPNNNVCGFEGCGRPASEPSFVDNYIRGPVTAPIANEIRQGAIDYAAYQDLGASTYSSVVLTAGHRLPIASSILAIEELAVGESSRAYDFNTPLTTHGRVERLVSIGLDIASTTVGYAAVGRSTTLADDVIRANAPNSLAGLESKIAARTATRAEWQAYSRQLRSAGQAVDIPANSLSSGSFVEFSRRSTARQFLTQQGWQGRRIETALSGIDLSQPVSVVNIPRGAAVEQWVKAGRNGNWFAPLGQAPELSGVSRGMRLPVGFQATGNVQALRSTALPITDTWTLGPNYPVVTPGGGTQYLVPNSQGLVPYWSY